MLVGRGPRLKKGFWLWKGKRFSSGLVLWGALRVGLFLVIPYYYSGNLISLKTVFREVEEARL